MVSPSRAANWIPFSGIKCEIVNLASMRGEVDSAADLELYASTPFPA